MRWEPARGIKRNPVSKIKGREEGRGKKGKENRWMGVMTKHEFPRLAPFLFFLY